MISYYWTVGTEHPYWFVTESVAGNQDHDDDKGWLTPEEFKRWFPHAMPIRQKEYDERSVTLAQYMKWRRKK